MKASHDPEIEEFSDPQQTTVFVECFSTSNVSLSTSLHALFIELYGVLGRYLPNRTWMKLLTWHFVGLRVDLGAVWRLFDRLQLAPPTRCVLECNWRLKAIHSRRWFRKWDALKTRNINILRHSLEKTLTKNKLARLLNFLKTRYIQPSPYFQAFGQSKSTIRMKALLCYGMSKF